MAFSPDTQVSLYQSLIAWVVILAAFGVQVLLKRRRQHEDTHTAALETFHSPDDEVARQD